MVLRSLILILIFSSCFKNSTHKDIDSNLFTDVDHQKSVLDKYDFSDYLLSKISDRQFSDTTITKLKLEYIKHVTKQAIGNGSVSRLSSEFVLDFQNDKDTLSYYTAMIYQSTELISFDCDLLDFLIEIEMFYNEKSLQLNSDELSVLLSRQFLCYLNLGLYDVARSLMFLGIDSVTKKEDAKYLNVYFGNLTASYLESENYIKALHYLKKLESNTRINDIPLTEEQENAFLYNIIICYFSLGNYEKCEYYIDYLINLNRFIPEEEGSDYLKLAYYLKTWLAYKQGDPIIMARLLDKTIRLLECDQSLNSVGTWILELAYHSLVNNEVGIDRLLKNKYGHQTLGVFTDHEVNLIKIKTTKNLPHLEKKIEWLNNAINSNYTAVADEIFREINNELTKKDKIKFSNKIDSLRIIGLMETRTIISETILGQNNKKNIEKLNANSSLRNQLHKTNLTKYYFISFCLLGLCISIFIGYEIITRVKQNKQKEDLKQRLDKIITLYKISNHDYVNYLEGIKIHLNNKESNVLLDEIKLKIKSVSLLREVENISLNRVSFNVLPRINKLIKIYSKMYKKELNVDAVGPLILYQNKAIYLKIIENIISNIFKHSFLENRLSIKMKKDGSLIFITNTLINDKDVKRIQAALSSTNIKSGLSIVNHLAKKVNLKLNYQSDGIITIAPDLS